MNNELILNIVGTPIGNLEDISLRAIKTLSESDVIFCEDTRVTHKLLKLLNIEFKGNLIRCDNFNEKTMSNKAIEYIKEGKIVSLVSDAGMPLISDPGFELVKKAKENSVFINVIAGPMAFSHALIKANFSSKFTFLGFLPEKLIQRQNFLKQLLPFTYVCYVSPHKLINVLEDFKIVFDKNIKLYLIKELTKLYETSWEGNPYEVLDMLKEQDVKGEFTLVFEIPKLVHTKVNKYKKIS